MRREGWHHCSRDFGGGRQARAQPGGRTARLWNSGGTEFSAHFPIYLSSWKSSFASQRGGQLAVQMWRDDVISSMGLGVNRKAAKGWSKYGGMMSAPRWARAGALAGRGDRQESSESGPGISQGLCWHRTLSRDKAGGLAPTEHSIAGPGPPIQSHSSPCYTCPYSH